MAKYICQNCGEIGTRENDNICKVTNRKHIWRSLPENTTRYICDECGEIKTTSISTVSYNLCKVTGQYHIWRPLSENAKRYICDKCGEIKTTSISTVSYNLCKVTGQYHIWRELEEQNNCEAFIEKETPKVKSNLERQNRLLEEQNRLLNEQTERKRRIEQERREESERKRKIAYEQEMKEESERNTLQLNDKFNSINDFAINNNMVRIKICLPRVNETCLEYIKEDCKTLFLSFEKENLFLNAEDYKKQYTIRIPKKDIKKIIESTKVQNYLSNNKNDDMIAIKEPRGFTIISPKSFVDVNQAGDQNEEVKIDDAPFIIWLKEEELLNFVNIYNDYIKNKKRKFAKINFLKMGIKIAIEFIFFLAVILIIVNSSIKESMGIVGFIAVPIIIGYTIFKIWKELTFISHLTHEYEI